jgi:hydrogenase-4 component F
MATTAMLLPLIVCLAAAVAAAATRGTRSWRWVGVASSVTILGSAVVLCGATLSGQRPTALGGLLAADALSAFMLLVVGSVGLVSSWAGFGAGGRDWSYGSLTGLFLAAMSLAVLTDNLGLVLVAIEATTVATAFLVGHQGTRRSLEAAWKYVILGSAGIALAFLGVVLLYTATQAAGDPTLSWQQLSGELSGLDPALMRLAGGLMVLGFATKVGLAPMHSWLPDAHSQAPAPVSGLMSGVLLSVAFYAILRVQAVVDQAVGPQFLQGLLLAAGLGSLAIAALLMIRQGDLKRMLAYSSIEHMGIIALAAAIGGSLAIAAALLHIFGHGLVKSSLFVVSGRIVTADGTAAIPAIRGLSTRRPDLAIPLILGLVALLGLPPFSLFFTEVAIAFAGFDAGLGWAIVIAGVLLLILFAAMVRLAAGMTLGAAGPAAAAQPGEREGAKRAGTGPQTPIAAALATAVVIGVSVGPLSQLLTAAAGSLAVRP